MIPLSLRASRKPKGVKTCKHCKYFRETPDMGHSGVCMKQFRGGVDLENLRGEGHTVQAALVATYGPVNSNEWCILYDPKKAQKQKTEEMFPNDYEGKAKER